MSLISRIVNVFRKARLRRDIDEELEDHIHHAMENGRTREEAERALGNAVRLREGTMDTRISAWLDSLVSDAVFGMRQLRRRPVATFAAIVSLALAIGSVNTAFRLIDAALFRPLPVSNPESLYVVSYTYFDETSGKTEEGDGFSYPLFRQMQDAVKGDADLMVVASTSRADLTFGSDEEMEKAYRQMVSGTHFSILGVQPALGRLFTRAEDVTPGGHPLAVLSHEYWTRRFGADPGVVGRTFRMGLDIYTIIGVAQKGYTGTETGTMTDFFVPAMQNKDAISRANMQWMRIWVRPRPGISEERLRQPLQTAMTAHRLERVKEWPVDIPKSRVDQYVNSALSLTSAANGASFTQKRYRQPLLILAAVVVFVLLIACANVANLLTAQAAARSKEMALRVSIGAGRWRLIQLVLMESLLLAVAAAALGALFALWAAPVVIGMINPRENPVRLQLPVDWRVLGFAAAVALGVSLLFGLLPGLRASRVKPSSALKGGDDPHARRRLMNALVAAQVAFCFLVHFGAGLFVATFDRLAHQPTGFQADGLLVLDAHVKGGGKAAERSAEIWGEIASRLGESAGVESVAYSGFPLMSGSAWTSDVRFGNRPPDSQSPYFLGVSPGWFGAMRIGLIEGRDFRPGDRTPLLEGVKTLAARPVIVNEAFARKYFAGASPIGKWFETLEQGKRLMKNEVVGYVRDARYRTMREPFRPTVYVPFGETNWASFTVRAAPSVEPLSLAQGLRRMVSRTRSEFLVTYVHTQEELVRNQTIRERLLASLWLFFAAVALMLAAVGLYGVLHYSVQQRRREIGIRLALGAPVPHVVRHVSTDVFSMLFLGSAIGLGAGLLSERYVQALLFEVKATDITMIVTPLAVLFAAALLAAVPPVLSATRTDPVNALRAE
ncbi:MAG: ABC transporter permease [Bryobacteraceae bacterium]